jgi:hypothetical protein
VELERLFRQIVRNLGAIDPARLRGPLCLSEIRDSIVPYRANRRSLQIETSEDYELALIRLFSGEAGLARTRQAELRAQFAREAASSNPNLELLQRHQDAELLLDPDAVAKVLDPEPDLRFAPRQSSISPATKPARRGTRTNPSSAQPSSGDRCRRCQATLPTGRVVNFCPQCGHDLTRLECQQCGNELEPTWKHCVSCGTSVAGNGSKAQRR